MRWLGYALANALCTELNDLGGVVRCDEAGPGEDGQAAARERQRLHSKMAWIADSAARLLTTVTTSCFIACPKEAWPLANNAKALKALWSAD